MKESKTVQYKVAKVLCLITGIPACAFALIALLAGEFLVFVVFGVIGAFLLFGAHKMKKALSEHSNQGTAQDYKPVSAQETTYEKAPAPHAAPVILNPAHTSTNGVETNQNNSKPRRTTENQTLISDEAQNNTSQNSYRVTGMSFHMKSIMKIAIENPEYDNSKQELIDSGLINERIWQYEFDPLHVELVPEPDNPADPNAIKVIVDGEHVGYIKSGSCTHLLKAIRENRIVDISCEMGGGKYKYISEEYDDEKDKDVYTMERSDCPFFVHLKINESK